MTKLFLIFFKNILGIFIKDEYYKNFILQVFMRILILMLIFLVIVIFLKVIVTNYPVEFNCAIIMLLFIGLVLDTRFKKNRIICFLIIIVIQIVLYKYLNYVPILLLKDLFWYSVILNLSFIWHVLILNWIYKISSLIDWEYGKYLSSRLSIITSLTLLTFIINSLLLWLRRYNGYFNDLENYIYYFKKNNKLDQAVQLESLLLSERKKSYFNFNLNWVSKVCILVLVILIYFHNVFHNYSKLLMGRNKKIDWKNISKQMYFFFITFFIGTILVSIFIGIPRLYLIWIVFGLQYLYTQWKLGKNSEINNIDRLSIKWLIRNDYEDDIFIYVKNFLFDYVHFYSTWDRICMQAAFNVYDWLYLFLYFPGYEKKILLFKFAHYLASEASQWTCSEYSGVRKELIYENNLRMTEKELELELYGNLDEPSDLIKGIADWRTTFYSGDLGYEDIMRINPNFNIIELTRWKYTLMARKLKIYKKILNDI